MTAPLKLLGSAGVGYLVASRVSKKLPGTLGWSLVWGTVATLGTYGVSVGLLKRPEDSAAALSSGIALGYLHAFSHQTPFPSKGGPATDPRPIALAARGETVAGLGARFLGDASTHAPGCMCGAH
jgi:hypothetical protein